MLVVGLAGPAWAVAGDKNLKSVAIGAEAAAAGINCRDQQLRLYAVGLRSYRAIAYRVGPAWEGG